MTTSRVKVLTRIDIKAFMRFQVSRVGGPGRKRLKVRSCGLVDDLAMAVPVPVCVPIVALGF
jgi:hypothetical protein